MTDSSKIKNKNISKRRKKVRRQAHKGRLAIVLGSLAAIMLVVILFSVDFGGADGGRDEHVTEAWEAGRRDAMKVLHTSAGSMDRDQALLNIHARASALRLNGYDAAADDYIEAATELLRQRNIIN